MGGFVESGHFDRYFVNNTLEKGPAGEIGSFFLLDTIETTPWIENSTQKDWQNQGTFFDF